jgi:predicted enzyme related to lactoylglutathione lyase
VWHELLTKDPVAAQEFYKTVIGWSTSTWEGDAGATPVDYTMWVAGETPVGGVMTLPAAAAEMGAPPNWLSYIEVPDVDTTVTEATKMGGTVLNPAKTAEGVGRFAILADPQGAVFAVITSATPLPEETDPRPLEFSWHELITTDAVAGLDFYHNLFGWAKKDEHDMGEMGIYHLFGRDRFAYGGAYKKPADMPAPPHWLHYVSPKDSADAAAERAKKAGATILHEPMEVPGGDRIAIIMDPQGATFAVHSKPKA